MNKLEWQGYEWLPNERWGQIHPDKTECWYDSSKVKIEDGVLKLVVGYNPKEFTITTIDPDGYDTVISPYGVGLISCTEEFGYGTFEIVAKLPKGQPYAWPAFWMWAFDSWPPEIDVFEAYSNKRGSYFNWSGFLIGKFWRCATNIHLGEAPRNYMLGAKNHFFGFKNPTKHFIKYSVVWEEDKIDIYYNDRCVRRIRDMKTLSQFTGKKMNVIINNGVQKEITNLDRIDDYWMEVKSFKFKPKQR